MLENIEAVIFDLDGTLVDSMWLWGSIDVEYLNRYDIDMPQDLKSEIEGMSFTETAHYFKKRFNINESIDKMKDEWNEMAIEYYQNRVPLKEGALELLKYLQANGIKMGIATSNSRELVKVLVDKYQLDNYIESIKTSCEVASGKSAPDIFLAVSKELGVEPQKCLVFEDVPIGIMAGKKAGMKVCAVYDKDSENMIKEKITYSDYYIESFADLLDKYNIKKA